METISELEELMNKESWTQEDCQKVQELALMLKGPVKKFRRLVERFAAEHPSPTGAAAVKLGIAKFMLCRFHEAIELLGKGTDNKERRYYQAQCYKCMRQWDKALENLRLAKDRGWDSRAIEVEMAEVHCLAGNIDEAEKIIRQIEKASQDDPNWHYVAGMIAELKGDYDTAEERYEQARQIQPGHPAATFRLAYYYDLHGDEEKAIELYLECITQPQAAQKKVATEGVPTTEQQPARPVHPILANALLNLAVLYEDAGKYDHAERCLRRILECNPNHARAQFDADAAVLRETAFRDVHVREDLDAGDDCRMQVAGRGGGIVEHAVHPIPHPQFLLHGFDVNVRGPLLKGIGEKVIDRIDDVLIRGGQLVRGPEFDILLQIAQVHHGPGELDLRLGDGALEPEKFPDELDDVSLGAHHGVYFHEAGPGDVLQGLHVERIRGCLLYTSPSPRDLSTSRMPSSA